MNRIFLLFVFIISVNQQAFGMAKAPSKPTATPTPSPTATPIPSPAPTATPVVGTVGDAGFGFNTPWMFGVLNNGPVNTSSELTEAVKRMHQPYMRFPGGTISRDYLMSSKGYNGQQQGATENYIYPFTRMFSPAGSPGFVKLFFQVNMDNHFNHYTYKGTDEELIEENLRAVKYLIDNGLAPESYELGNEESLTPQLFWRMNDSAFKPLETVQENYNILVDIRITHANDQAYTEAHFKDGLDKFQSLVATYRSRLIALHASRGLPVPKFGVPIHTMYHTNAKYYGDTRFFLQYYNTRVRDIPNLDAVIPHQYLIFEKGKSAVPLAEMDGIFLEYRSFFGATKELWVTEFNAQVNIAGVSEDDTDEQVAVLEQMVQIFKKYGSTRYFLHQFFTDTSTLGYGAIYKNASAGSHPLNGIVDASTGKLIPNPQLDKKLFYSPQFCWAAKVRGASIEEYNGLKNEYGCK